MLHFFFAIQSKFVTLKTKRKALKYAENMRYKNVRFFCRNKRVCRKRLFRTSQRSAVPIVEQFLGV